MNETSKHLFEILTKLSESEVDYFRVMIADIDESDLFVDKVEKLCVGIRDKYDMDNEELGKLVVYYMGLDHGMDSKG